MDDETEPETGPLRRCIVTRERLPKERMIRFVVGPDRQIVPDLASPPAGAVVPLRVRVQPHLLVDVARSYYFNFGSQLWSPQFTVTLSP